MATMYTVCSRQGSGADGHARDDGLRMESSRCVRVPRAVARSVADAVERLVDATSEPLDAAIARAEAAVDAATIACVLRTADTAWRAMAGAPRALAAVFAALEAREARLRDAYFGSPDAAPRNADAARWFEWLHARHEVFAQFATDVAERLPLPSDTQRRVLFALRTWLALVAPEHTLAGHPGAWLEAFATDGESLRRGLAAWQSDTLHERVRAVDTADYRVGVTVATTPGDVVWRNDLVELIAYRPRGDRVRATPLLVVPPFINRFPILDLRPERSLVAHLVDAGLSVFLVSWRAAGREIADATWDRFVIDGVEAAVRRVCALTGARRTHLAGYCIGGTLAACAAARRPAPIAGLALLAAPLDFAHAGDVAATFDRPFVDTVEAAFAPAGGVVRGERLALMFAALRPREQLARWSVERWLLGRHPAPDDLLAWNADVADVPGRVIAWVLRHGYLDNALVQPGAVRIGGRALDLRRVTADAWVLGNRDDHIVPWPAAHRSAAALGGDVRFVCASGGHVAGVVTGREADRRDWACATFDRDESAQGWARRASRTAGTWWHDWTRWLDTRAGEWRSAAILSRTLADASLGPSPGQHVHEASRLDHGA
jgi:polyhydroxyalkanoate synthase